VSFTFKDLHEAFKKLEALGADRCLSCGKKDTYAIITGLCFDCWLDLIQEYQELMRARAQ